MVKATYRQGTLANLVTMRLHPGCDLVEGITEVCRRLEVKNGCIISCIGSLQRAAFMVAVPMNNKIGAGYSDPITMEGPLELLSGQGHIGTDEEGSLFLHLHGAFTDGRGNGFGGHMVKGACPVLVTCEVTIGLFEGIRLAHTYDPEVELKILLPTDSHEVRKRDSE